MAAKNKKTNLLSSGIIAEANKQIDKENEDRKAKGLKERKKFGEYTEATGGGTPIPKGKTKEDMEGKPGFHRVSQPRDEDGKFTYNSANGKELEYGPSRGTTVPPFLRGVVLTCIEKGTTMKTEELERILSAIDMSVDQIIENCKHYLEDEKGFAGLIGGFITKKGRESKSEKDNVGITGKKDLSKAGETTKNSLAQAKAEYDKAEQSKSMPEPGLNSGASRYYNKAGVTQKGLEQREAWREMLKKKAIEKNNTPAPTTNSNSKETPVAPAPTPTPNKKDTTTNNNDTTAKDNNWNVEKAKSDPKQFLKDNVSLVKKMMSMVPGMTASKAVSLVASGKIKDFEHFKNIVEKHNNKE